MQTDRVIVHKQAGFKCLWYHFRELDTWEKSQHRFWIILLLLYSLIASFSFFSISSFISSLFFLQEWLLSLQCAITTYVSAITFLIFALFCRKGIGIKRPAADLRHWTLCVEGLKETMKHLSRDSQYSGRYPNKIRALHFTAWTSLPRTVEYRKWRRGKQSHLPLVCYSKTRIQCILRTLSRTGIDAAPCA